MNESSMRALVERKRDGGELTAEQWHSALAAFVSGAVDEAQMAALCMACVLNGMSFEESRALTAALVEGGKTLTFDAAEGLVVDKHSSGGVSDIVSLAAVPLAAAAGVRVAKLSGRALGHTGGTIDKLEAIPGMRTDLHPSEFVRIVRQTGCAIAAQSADLVPGDRLLYKLRDRTATVPSMGLIAASIASKKIAGGAHAIVFDVKTGTAAFMREREKAAQLSSWLVRIAESFGRRASAYVTDMHQPLGRFAGTGLEVLEARELLRGNGDRRAHELVVSIASELVAFAWPDAAERVSGALQSGAAHEKLLQMIAAQGSDASALDRMRMPEPSAVIRADRRGFVRQIHTVKLGHVARRLSARDALAGIAIAVRLGELVEAGTPVVRVYGGDSDAVHTLADAVTIGEETAVAPPLIYDVTNARYPR